MPSFNEPANQSQIDLVSIPNALKITREPVAINTPEVYAFANIVGIIPVKIQTRPAPSSPDYDNWKYRFDKVIVVDIEFDNGNHLSFDIQEITNQAGWTANLAGQQQAVADISAQL